MPRRVYPPTIEEVSLLANAMPTRSLRSFTLVAAWSGLRLHEVAALEAVDVDLTTRAPLATLRVRDGKGGKERDSLLFEPGVAALREVLLDIGPLFTLEPTARWRKRRPLTRQWVNKQWHVAREACGLERFWFHDLRKFHGSWLINERGKSYEEVAFQLGHIDRFGCPNIDLVRRVYGFPDPRRMLDRIAS